MGEKKIGLSAHGQTAKPPDFFRLRKCTLMARNLAWCFRTCWISFGPSVLSCMISTKAGRRIDDSLFGITGVQS